MKLQSGTKPDEALKYPEWQQPYLEALIAPDAGSLQQAIAVAEAAILERLRAISDITEHRTERLAIEDALTTLRVLKRENRGLIVARGDAAARESGEARIAEAEKRLRNRVQ